MRFVRRCVAVLPWAVLVACAEHPTLAGTTSGVGHGALLAYRQTINPGFSDGEPTWYEVDPETGASLEAASWLRGHGEVVFSRDGNSMVWVEAVYGPVLNPLDCPNDLCFQERLSQTLFVSRVGSSGKTALTPQYQYDRHPAFSPGGDRLVVLREYTNSEEQMISIALDGGDVRPLLPRSGRRRDRPDWSPRTQQIVYRRPEIAALYVVNADGTNPHAITDSNAVTGPGVWSPDGSMIAVAVQDRARPLYSGQNYYGVLRADGSEIARFPVLNSGQRPVWSPDGSRLAYCASGELHLLNIRTGVARLLSTPAARDCLRPPMWRP
jgi:Tol biopolymer transport system component